MDLITGDSRKTKKADDDIDLTQSDSQTKKKKFLFFSKKTGFRLNLSVNESIDRWIDRSINRLID